MLLKYIERVLPTGGSRDFHYFQLGERIFAPDFVKWKAQKLSITYFQ